MRRVYPGLLAAFPWFLAALGLRRQFLPSTKSDLVFPDGPIDPGQRRRPPDPSPAPTRRSRPQGPRSGTGLWRLPSGFSRRRPGNLAFQAIRAEAHSGANKLEIALAEFTDVLKADPKNVRALEGRGANLWLLRPIRRSACGMPILG